jgi:hypothetical protein
MEKEVSGRGGCSWTAVDWYGGVVVLSGPTISLLVSRRRERVLFSLPMREKIADQMKFNWKILLLAKGIIIISQI